MATRSPSFQCRRRSRYTPVLLLLLLLDEAYAFIQENEGVHWYCKSRHREVSKIQITELHVFFQERQDKMDTELEVFKKETKKKFNDIKGEITQIRKNQGETERNQIRTGTVYKTGN